MKKRIILTGLALSAALFAQDSTALSSEPYAQRIEEFKAQQIAAKEELRNLRAEFNALSPAEKEDRKEEFRTRAQAIHGERRDGNVELRREFANMDPADKKMIRQEVRELRREGRAERREEVLEAMDGMTPEERKAYIAERQSQREVFQNIERAKAGEQGEFMRGRNQENREMRKQRADELRGARQGKTDEEREAMLETMRQRREEMRQQIHQGVEEGKTPAEIREQLQENESPRRSPRVQPPRRKP
jgi:hypothetical protein